MTKYADAKLDETWIKLTEIEGCSSIAAGAKVELYNAGTGEILFAENASEPDDTTFHKTIKPRHEAKFVYSADFYVKSAAGTAKLIVSDYA